MKNTDLPVSEGTAGSPAGRSRKRTVIWWGVILLIAVYLLLPMLKGLYYRVQSAPADGIAWRMDLPAALAESARTGKPVLADFSATWCPPCQVMKHEVWPNAQVAKTVNENYIPVALDADADGSNGPAQQYGVRTIPTVLILDSKGKILRAAHSLDVAGLLRFLADK